MPCSSEITSQNCKGKTKVTSFSIFSFRSTRQVSARPIIQTSPSLRCLPRVACEQHQCQSTSAQAVLRQGWSVLHFLSPFIFPSSRLPQWPRGMVFALKAEDTDYDHTERHNSRFFGYSLFVCWLLNVPATCECISGTNLHRQFYVLPH